MINDLEDFMEQPPKIKNSLSEGPASKENDGILSSFSGEEIKKTKIKAQRIDLEKMNISVIEQKVNSITFQI
jgi:hypothetical protein